MLISSWFRSGSTCLAAILVVACVQAQTVYLASADTITARVGEEFAIRLFSNPSTGYSWTLSGLPEDGPLRLEKNRIVPRRDDHRVGTSGEEEWIFRGMSAGRVTLRYVWARSWENKPPARIEEFVITVR